MSALSERLEEALTSVSHKEAEATELRNRLEEVQVGEGGDFFFVFHVVSCRTKPQKICLLPISLPLKL